MDYIYKHYSTLTSRRNECSLLVLDDDPVFLSLIEFYLEDSGYQITLCDSVENAMALLKINEYDMVLCDLTFPGLSGTELCKELRKNESFYHYFIFLTGNNSDTKIEEGFMAGADDYIKKGVSKTEILARLDAGLRLLLQQKLLKQQREKIEKQAITDILTNCYNRRYLIEHGQNEVKRALRYQYDFSVIMCDVDHFKKINDTYSHQAGDCVLRKFADTLKSILREDIDAVCRYGGEEFIVLLPNSTLSDAYIVAEKLRINTQKMSILWEEKLISVTASFGISDLKTLVEPSFDALLSQADKYLYQAKNNGRNRIEPAFV